MRKLFIPPISQQLLQCCIAGLLLDRGDVLFQVTFDVFMANILSLCCIVGYDVAWCCRSPVFRRHICFLLHGIFSCVSFYPRTTFVWLRTVLSCTVDVTRSVVISHLSCCMYSSIWLCVWRVECQSDGQMWHVLWDLILTRLKWWTFRFCN